MSPSCLAKGKFGKFRHGLIIAEVTYKFPIYTAVTLAYLHRPNRINFRGLDGTRLRASLEMARFGFSITLISAVPAAAFIPRPNALTATRRTSNWQGGSTEAAPLGSTEKEGENSLLGWAARPAGVEKEGEGPLLGDSLVVSDLPDSFDQAVEGAAACTVQALADGWSRLRVDFDTSGGDATYTMLKSSMPMTQRFIASTAAPLLGGATNSEAGGEEGAASERTIRLYFPNAG